MEINDSKAAEQFLEKLKGFASEPPPTQPIVTQITINRPVRCTIVFGAAAYTQQTRKGGPDSL